MSSDTPSRKLQADERAYLYARLVLLAIITILYMVGFPVAAGTVAHAMHGAVLVLFAVSTAALFVAIFWWGVNVERAMLYVLSPDLPTVAALVYLGMDGDVFYPLCVLIPVAYALVVRKREAWTVGAATGIAYMAAHALYPHFTAITYAVFALKALAIPLVGAMVASSVAKQREREDELVLAMRQNREIADRLQRRVSELQAVSEITDVIHSSLDFDTVGPVVLDIVAKLIDVESCCLFIIDKQHSETIFSASVGSADYSVAERAYGTGVLDDHFTCTSVFDRAEIMVLFCASAADVERLSSEDSLVVAAVASELVVAVENSRLYKLTKRLAITDELTDLFNYRHLQQRLSEETGRARRYGKHVSLLMIDVDDFKHFNDVHGHIPGDTALADLAAVLRSCVREVDVVARYGGEEFSIVLPETDAAGAYVVAEKIRETVSLHKFEAANGERDCTLTVSIGIATLPTHADDKESLLREADDALYVAKHGGKNRVRTPLRPVPQPDETHLPTGV